VQEPRVNDDIPERAVQIIGPDGSQLGIKPLPEALRIARGLSLDLVEVAPDADPPVCKILDYGRFKYEQTERAKESRRRSPQRPDPCT